MTLTLPNMFCSVDDVEARVGRDLSVAEAEQARLLCAMATLSVMASLGVGPSFEPSEDVAPVLGMFTIEVAYRVMVNPERMAQRSETIGSYSYTEMFGPRTQEAPGLALTPAEELMIRRVVFGTSSSVVVRSLADDYAENVWYALWSSYYSLIGDESVIDDQSLITWK